jgi:hypothetical protein
MRIRPTRAVELRPSTMRLFIRTAKVDVIGVWLDEKMRQVKNTGPCRKRKKKWRGPDAPTPKQTARLRAQPNLISGRRAPLSKCTTKRTKIRCYRAKILPLYLPSKYQVLKAPNALPPANLRKMGCVKDLPQNWLRVDNWGTNLLLQECAILLRLCPLYRGRLVPCMVVGQSRDANRQRNMQISLRIL